MKQNKTGKILNASILLPKYNPLLFLLAYSKKYIFIYIKNNIIIIIKWVIKLDRKDYRITDSIIIIMFIINGKVYILQTKVFFQLFKKEKIIPIIILIKMNKIQIFLLKLQF